MCVILESMGDTPGRLLRLLSLLQMPRAWPGDELARRLRVSRRTVRRDVERLRELGYPVRTAMGAGGGYRLAAGTAMPPLLLDDEEAVAIVVGLRTAAANAIEGIEEASVRALAKLEQVLPSRLRQRVATLSAATVPPVPPVPQPDGRAVDPACWRWWPRVGRGAAAAVRLRLGRRRTQPPAGGAVPAGHRGPPLVPGRLRQRAGRLADVPRRPDHRAVGALPAAGASAATWASAAAWA